MGGVTNKPLGIDKDWELIERKDAYNLLKGKNGQLGEEYSYVLDNRYAPSTQLDIFEQRRTSTVPIVKTLGAEYKVGGSGLTPQNNFRVITENIPYRLSSSSPSIRQVPQLTQPESLYVLNQSLLGYSHLYDKVGAFKVNGDMIGFTPNGQAKVWLNQNFGSNHPSHGQNILRSTLGNTNYLRSSVGNSSVPTDEAQMVRNIVDVVESKCEAGTYSPNLKANLKAPGVGFKEAQRIVQQAITDEKGYPINRIDLINNTIKIRGNQQQTRYMSHQDNNIVYETFKKAPIVNTYVPSAINYANISHARQINYDNVSYNTIYKPMPSAKTSNLKFNYIQPKENFHPNMYVAERI